MYLIVKCNLKRFFGEDDIYKDWEKELGLMTNSSNQFDLKNGETCTIFKVLDEKKCEKYLQKKDNCIIIDKKESVIDFIKEEFVEKYVIYDRELYRANLYFLIKKNKLNLDELKVELNYNEEAKYLYEHGISGIQKTSFDFSKLL